MYTRVQSVTCLGLPLQKHSNTHARFKLQHCSAAPRLTDLAGVVDYLHTTKPAIVQHPVEDIIELTEGKLNHVYLVTCQGNGKRHQFILKHAPPYAKCMGEALPLSQERLRVEFEAMQLLNRHAPEHVPTIFHYDEGESIMAMQYLPAPHDKVMLGLHKHGHCFPMLAQHVSNLLSSSLFFTSALALTPGEMDSSLRRFANSVIVEANERVVLSEPLDPTCLANRQLSPAVQPHADALRSDAGVLQDLKDCVQCYRTKKEALLHNDLHTGNLLATASSTYLIDWEFASVGPMGFDLGCLLGVLILAFIVLRRQPEAAPTLPSPFDTRPQLPKANSSAGPARVGTSAAALPVGKGAQGSHPPDETGGGGREAACCRSREQQCKWLLGTMVELWCLLCQKFQVLHKEASRARASRQHGSMAEGARDASGAASPCSCSVWVDTLGFAAFCLIRLTIGMHAYPGYQFLQGAVRSEAEISALRVARELLQLRSAAKATGAAAATASPASRMEQVVMVVRHSDAGLRTQNQVGP